MLAIAVRGKAGGEVETRFAAGDDIQHQGRRDGAGELGEDVGQQLPGWGAASGKQADRDGWVEMAAGNVADRIGHAQHGQAECQGYPDEANADVREFRREHGTAAAAQDEPEGADEFGCDFFRSGMAAPPVELRSDAVTPNG